MTLKCAGVLSVLAHYSVISCAGLQATIPSSHVAQLLGSDDDASQLEGDQQVNENDINTNYTVMSIYYFCSAFQPFCWNRTILEHLDCWQNLMR